MGDLFTIIFVKHLLIVKTNCYYRPGVLIVMLLDLYAIACIVLLLDLSDNISCCTCCIFVFCYDIGAFLLDTSVLLKITRFKEGWWWCLVLFFDMLMVSFLRQFVLYFQSLASQLLVLLLCVCCQVRNMTIHLYTVTMHMCLSKYWSAHHLLWER